jgi:hypothetical protein
MHTDPIQLALIKELFLSSKIIETKEDFITLKVPADLYFAALHARQGINHEPERYSESENSIEDYTGIYRNECY